MKKDLIAGFLFLATVGTVLAARMWFPHLLLWRIVNRHLIHILVVTFVVGLLSAALSKNRLMLISFALASVLSVYLKERSTGLFQRARPRVGDMVITAMHINLSAARDVESVLAVINEIKPQVLTLQEFTPDWYAALRDTLSVLFPTRVERIGLDPFSMGVYTSCALVSADTMALADLNWLQVTLSSGRRDTFSVISVLLLPQVNPSGIEMVQHQISQLSRSVNSLGYPVLLMGDLNQLPWSDELFRLRQLTGLLDARVNYLPKPTDSGSFFNTPLDYTYHSPMLSAFAYGDLPHGKNSHLGTWANFQFKPDYDIVNKSRE